MDGCRICTPDDETIACGAQLGRLDGVSVMVVIDGAPRHIRKMPAAVAGPAIALAERAGLQLVRAALADFELWDGRTIHFTRPEV